MTSFTITVDASSAILRMQRMPARLRTALGRVVQRLAIEIQARTKEKLTGEVLHVRTGTLRRSINQKVVQAPDGVFGSVGTNVEYAAVHEYGFDGVVNVSAHLRRSKAQFSLSKSKRPGKSEGDIFVQAHSRHVVLPERSFLRSTIREFEAKIQEDLRQAAGEVLQS